MPGSLGRPVTITVNCHGPPDGPVTSREDRFSICKGWLYQRTFEISSEVF